MNPLNNGNTPTPGQLSPQMMNNINNIKGLMNQFKSISNPNIAMQQMAQSNPMFNQVMQMCNGQNPKDVFMSMCKQKGIDPEAILKELRS